MIFGLLHGRRLTAPPSGGIVGAPDYQSLSSFSSGEGQSSTASIFNVSPDGSWASSGNGSITKSGLWYNPLSPGAGGAYEVRITPTHVSGSTSVLSNPASDWVSLSVLRSLQATLSRFTVGTSTSVYSVLVEIRLPGGAVVSSGTFTLTNQVSVTKTGVDCVGWDTLLPDGRLVRDLREGDSVLCLDVRTGAVEAFPLRAIRFGNEPVYQLRTESGASIKQSESTPMDVPDGRVVRTPDMVGELVAVKRGDTITWERVAAVEFIGQETVIRLDLGNRMFFAGDAAQAAIATHNATQKA